MKDSENVTIAKKAKVYHVHKEEKKKPTDNFKGCAFCISLISKTYIVNSVFILA